MGIMQELYLGADSQEEVKLLVPKKQNSQKSNNNTNQKRRKVNNNNEGQSSSDEQQILLHMEGSLQVANLQQLVSDERLRMLMEESEKVLQDQAFFEEQNIYLPDQIMDEAIVENLVLESQHYLSKINILDSKKIVKDEPLFLPSYDKLPYA